MIIKNQAKEKLILFFFLNQMRLTQYDINERKFYIIIAQGLNVAHKDSIQKTLFH